MTSCREYFAFLTAMIMVSHCKTDFPPPPTKLKSKWLDPFTVNVSWEKPIGLPAGSDVQYKYCLMKNGEDKSVTRTIWTNFTDTCLTEEMDSDHWTYSVWTVLSQSSNSSSESRRVNITIKSRKPRAEVVQDFKCVIHPNETRCSWIPVHPSLNLKLSYRTCYRTSVHFEENTKGLKECHQPYSSGNRNVCHLKVDATLGDICIDVDTEAGMSSFIPVPEVPSPKLRIAEIGDVLKLSWTRPEVGKNCYWIYELCYKQCNNPKKCQNSTTKNEATMEVTYDESCLYEFQSRVSTSHYCPKIFSDFSEVVTYGTNKPPDGTLTVIAIVVPIVLSVCVLLSCYCFRRHSNIICPVIPDPSAIFKEMMMNGNKELKTGSLYTPVPETICPIHENSNP